MALRIDYDDVNGEWSYVDGSATSNNLEIRERTKCRNHHCKTTWTLTAGDLVALEGFSIQKPTGETLDLPVDITDGARRLASADSAPEIPADACSRDDRK